MDFREFTEKYQQKEVTETPNVVEGHPTVSVCVQTYQHASYIRDCLDGILMQKTGFPFEILLGEDNSKDGTREICIEYAKNYPGKIRLFLHHRENNMAIDGRPTGRFVFLYNLFHANGKYMAFCEGDDYWTDPLKLQKQIGFLEQHPDYAFSMGRLKKKTENTGQVVEKRELNSTSKKQLTLRDYLLGNFSQLSTFVFRKKNMRIPAWLATTSIADQSLVILAAKTGKIKYHNDFFSVYRINEGSLTHSIDAGRFKKGALEWLDQVNRYTDCRYSNIIAYRKRMFSLFYRILKSRHSMAGFFHKAVYVIMYKLGVFYFKHFHKK